MEWEDVQYYLLLLLRDVAYATPLLLLWVQWQALRTDRGPYYCCGHVPRRAVLTFVACVFFVGYLVDVVLFGVYGHLLYAAQDRQTYCFGIRCPSHFSCRFQHDTTLLTRYAVEVVVGTCCSFLGVMGAWNWGAKEMRIFAAYLVFLTGVTLFLGVCDAVYDYACEVPPANVVASMPVIGQHDGGRARLERVLHAEVHPTTFAVVDKIFGYDVSYWYLWSTLVWSQTFALIATECFSVADSFVHGFYGLGPNFSISDEFGQLYGQWGDFRLEVAKRARRHREVVAGYGTVPTLHA